MNSDLRLDWCSYEAAAFAVRNWHYSKRMPVGKLIKIGVWEDTKYSGCILFGRGAGPQIGCPYNLEQVQVCELVRIALDEHRTAVSRMVAIALRILKKKTPGLRLVTSYADPEQEHYGGIYQAGNWIHVGRTKPCKHFESVLGRRIHSKSLRSGNRGLATHLLKIGAIKQVKVWKYKYLYPLDKAMRKQIEPLRQPYPKRAGSIDGDASGDHPEEGGSSPTPALQQ